MPTSSDKRSLYHRSWLTQLVHRRGRNVDLEHKPEVVIKPSQGGANGVNLHDWQGNSEADAFHKHAGAALNFCPAGKSGIVARGCGHSCMGAWRDLAYPPLYDAHTVLKRSVL
eukprot:304176-Amphidinium_carterae.3